MATKRHIKHDLYLNFHAALQNSTQPQPNGTGSGDNNFNDRERRFFKWFIVLCLTGVAITYWLCLKG